MTDNKVRQVTDVATLKAVAHPLRVRLLGALRIEGPATASQLARRFDESSGSTSYHLRVLQKHGFIEEDPEQPNARDRRWRAVHQFTAWNNSEFAKDPEGAEAAAFLRNQQLDNVVGATRTFESTMEKWGPDWVAAAGHSDSGGRLSADSLVEFRERVEGLLADLVARDRGKPDAELVRVYLAAFPVSDTKY